MRIENRKGETPNFPPRARVSPTSPPEATRAEAPFAEPEAVPVEGPAPVEAAAPAEAPIAPPPSMPRVSAPLPQRAVEALRQAADELLIGQAVAIGHPLRRRIGVAVDYIEAILVAHTEAVNANRAAPAEQPQPEAAPPAASTEPEAAAVNAPESKRK